ncbi:bifunctional diguanylate cyclase/phosphodiesterase [Chelativorans sp. ZYF759]|uniref:putative bifunctional diguanylate cyclase/phosphodiesterase n=1 Tax=Chelativorans sp. ZYF759 TaxID=2692213 RepID=UPI001AEDA9E2|nr:EAL domain-containing protein [Chelativorans sp. ZYF759]
MMNRLLAGLTSGDSNPDLIRAQLDAFLRQLPLLHLTLLVSIICIAAIFFGHAPDYLTLYVPAALMAVFFLRAMSLRRIRTEAVDDRTAQRVLRVIAVLAVLLAASFAAWSLALLPHGEEQQKLHALFFMCIAAICTIFCLAHVRAAVFTIIALIIGPIVLYFGSSGHPIFTAMAINMAFVVAAMVYVLQTNHRTLTAMVGSQKELSATQAQASCLSDENLRLAHLDSLTGLPNRRQFFARLEERFDLASQDPCHGFAVALIDLDGFKPVNDLYGHGVGDKVLLEVGERLQAFASDSIFVARLGGDEFGLMMDGTAPDSELTDLGQAVCTALQQPYELPEALVKLSASIGLAAHGTDQESPRQLMELADYALYEAKQHHRGSTILFSEGLDIQLREMMQLDLELRGSDLESDFGLEFQPVVDADSGRVIAFEALARWSSPSRGPVSPAVFIPIAERTDTINKITPILFGRALEAAAQWPRDVSISFNLSVRDIMSPSALMELIDRIDRSGIDPSRIILEITETALMLDFEVAVDALELLKQRGVQIALDDFGTGYSSLGYVHRLPLDKIKIDRSFLADIDSNPVSLSIVKTIIDLSRNLGLGCVAEGMETRAQVEILRTLGCEAMQGYFFSRPVALTQTGPLALSGFAMQVS